MRKFRTAMLVLALAAEVPADTLFLRDGTALKGRLVSASARRIRFIEAGQRAAQTYTRTTIQRVAFGDNNLVANASGERSRAANPTILAGTVITVHMVDSINSDKNNAGSSYKATVEEQMVVDGKTVVPQGAEAIVRVERSGAEEIGLVLSEITVNGRKYAVMTENAEAAKSRGKESGAGVGAVIGAIAGRGAAIQAIRGQKIQIPSETNLDFRLAQSMYIQ
jgi:hypothetical protein